MSDWALKEINDNQKDFEDYCDNFVVQAEESLEKGFQRKKEVQERISNEWVSESVKVRTREYSVIFVPSLYRSILQISQVFDENVQNRNYTKECKNMLRKKFIISLNGESNRKIEACEKTFSKLVDEYLKLANNSIQIFGNYNAAREVLKKCSQNYEGVGDVLRALTCFKNVSFYECVIYNRL